MFYRRDSVQNDVELPPAFLVWLLPINVRDLTHGGDFYYQLCVASFDRDSLRLLYVEWFVPLKGVVTRSGNDSGFAQAGTFAVRQRQTGLGCINDYRRLKIPDSGNARLGVLGTGQSFVKGTENK